VQFGPYLSLRSGGMQPREDMKRGGGRPPVQPPAGGHTHENDHAVGPTRTPVWVHFSRLVPPISSFFFCVCFPSGRSCFGSSPKQSLIINCCHICHYWSCFALHAPSLKKEIAILDTHTLVLCSFHHKML